jgi:hypothetical protein
MMQEKELIARLKEMRSIEPSKDWVSFNKRELLGADQGFSFSALNPAFAGVFSFLVIFGIVGYGMVKNSMPGDLLYSVRKVANFGESFFVSEQDMPTFQLSLANDRLEDMVKASERNLAPAKSEFKANISEAARTLITMQASTSSSQTIEKLVKETKKLGNNVEVLASVLGEDEDSADPTEIYKKVAEICIQELEGMEEFLSEEKAETLSQMKEMFEGGNYMDVLDLRLRMND